jgi:trans-aconitate methyltransferase
MIHVNDALQSERSKYEQMWAVDAYLSDNRAGEDNVSHFIAELKPQPYETLIDLGCGPGKAGLHFVERAQLSVHWLDITDAVLDRAVPRERFVEAPIWSPRWRGARRTGGWDYGFCVDVIEHLPTEYTMLALSRIVENCCVSWLQIALLPDAFGQVINQTLHLTVRPFTWWRDRIADIGPLVDCRDLCGRGLYLVER